MRQATAGAPAMKAPKWRQERQEGTRRMLAAARECIREIAAAPAPQLAEGTRHAAHQLALRAQPYVARLDALPAHASETWVAAANLVRALERIEAVTTSPEGWAGLPTLFDASTLLSAADQQTLLAQQVAQQVAQSTEAGGRGGRPVMSR